MKNWSEKARRGKCDFCNKKPKEFIELSLTISYPCDAYGDKCYFCSYECLVQYILNEYLEYSYPKSISLDRIKNGIKPEERNYD